MNETAELALKRIQNSEIALADALSALIAIAMGTDVWERGQMIDCAVDAIEKLRQQGFGQIINIRIEAQRKKDRDIARQIEINK